MQKTGFKNQKRSKIGWLFIAIAVFVMIALAVFLILYFVNAKKGEERTAEKNITYANHDYSYRPDINQINYDHSENTIYFNNLLIVYTFTDLNEKASKGLADKVDGTIVGDISGSVNALQIKVKESSLKELNEMANVLMEDENVLFAGYDYPIQMSDSSISSDPWSRESNNPESDLGVENNPNGNDWWAEAIGAYTAWDNMHNVSSIKVGIIDSGFDVDHDDLKGKISFLDDYKANSEDDHGTHVAGLIGAITDNEIGIRGIVDKVDLVCVDWNPITNDTEDNRYVTYLSTGEYIEITKRLVEDGAKVINNSWGTHIYSKEGYTQDLYGESNDLWFLLQYFAVHTTGAYDEYIDYIKTRAKRTGTDSMLLIIELMLNGQEDFIVVQAAGNGYDNGGKGYEAEHSGYFCAVNNDRYNILSEESRTKLSEAGINYNTIKEHICIVGAVKNQKNGENYEMTGFSNFGSSIDICAPGEGIFSTITNNDYKLDSGTSMAAPIATGSIALVWATDASLTAAQVKSIIINSSTTKAIGVGDGAGKEYPMLNVGSALKAATKANTPSAILPAEAFGEYSFSSGVGGWSTVLQLNNDLSFSGVYHDSDLDHTIICEFTGTFSDVKKIDDYTYQLTKKTLTPKYEKGYKYKEGTVSYECTDQPYGLEDCDTFYIYLKGREVKDLSEEFLVWVYHGYNESVKAQPLGLTCIRNEKYNYGFCKTDAGNNTNGQLSETDIRKIADDQIGNVVQFEYHDYDNNGTKEAFFVSAVVEDGFCSLPWKVYFVNSDGQIELMHTDSDSSYYIDDSKKYLEANDAQGFFFYNKGAYGSGWLTDIYSVKGGEPKKLKSEGIQGFNQKDDGTFYTTQNEFKEGGGHLYPEYELIYDSSYCEFTIGSKLR